MKYKFKQDLPPCLTISQSVRVNIHPDPPVTRDVDVQVNIFLATSSPKQPSTPVTATTFSFTDEDEM